MGPKLVQRKGKANSQKMGIKRKFGNKKDFGMKEESKRDNPKKKLRKIRHFQDNPRKN